MARGSQVYGSERGEFSKADYLELISEDCLSSCSPSSPSLSVSLHRQWHPFFARIPLDSPFRKELGIPDDVYISPEEDTIISEADAVKVMPKKKRKKIIRRRRKKAAGGAVGGGGGGGAGDAVDPDDVEFEEIELDTDEDDDGVEMVEVEGKAEE